MLLKTIVSILICILSILVFRLIAFKLNLVDSPDARKQHQGRIPLIGGVSIYFALLIPSLYFLEHSVQLIDFLLAITVVCFIGLLDDRFQLSAKFRFFMQLLVAIFLAYKTDIQLDYFGNLTGFGELYLRGFSGPVAIFSMIVGMNAFNMLDGIDGLSASLCLLCLAAIGLITNDFNLQVISVVTIASIAVFLIFNLGLLGNSYKIFLGDAGSMMLGLIVAWFLITASQSDVPDFKPVTALWLIAVPLIDMTSVMLKRLRRGESMMKADREHFHHKLIDLGMSARQALFFIFMFALFLLLFGLFLDKSDVPEYISFYIFLFLIFIYNLIHSKISKIERAAPRNDIETMS